MRTGLVVMAALTGAAAVGLTGCGNTATNTYNEVVTEGPPEGLRVGVPTTVALRPDVLGASAALPVPASTENFNGAGLTISGTLVSSGAGWLVLDEPGGQRRWVRVSNATWIRQPTPAPTGTTGGASGPASPG
jgi:hypothetical protein